MQLSAIAIDDEPVALSVIRAHAAKVPYLDVRGYYTNAFEAVEHLQREKIDVIFLDIKMPDISGMDFLISLADPPMVVFTTAYSEHAVQSFELDAVDYLLKPFSFARFLKACNKVENLAQLKQRGPAVNTEATYIFVKSGYEQYKILLDDILYLESAGNYVTFVLKDKKLLSRVTMQEALALLPASQFTRIHRSFIVANNKVDKIDRNAVYVGQEMIGIGSAYADAISRIL
ncbi:DNA-binding response regulator [Chitinophaga parva]|uniref:DNA-binding response regulator n=1 Tax=Chitinophaga parva TaxID=2169414 RepID=A0A2T7BGQ2_9BACT|nr:LytTR family DNA-binding domain-containing protein [Chitinophaga parva]PUZ25469.1 DNA-binding response regulator [Chitinophaga parva]